MRVSRDTFQGGCMMENKKYLSEQDKEIETIEPRTFKLNLSDADVNRIFEKAGSHNLTPEKLLESFIGDLVCGTYTNGSDERMYAGQWFERCWFSWMYEKTFLAYLAQFGLVDDVVGLSSDIEFTQEEIEYLEKEPDAGEEEIEDYRVELKEYENRLTEHYQDYVKWAEKASERNCHEFEKRSLDEELKDVIRWDKSREEMLNISGIKWKELRNE